MCDPISIGTAIVGSLLSTAMAPKPPKMPEPVAPTPPPQAQAAKAPDEQARRAASSASAGGGAFAGPASTMLTGTGGVAPGSLNLGRNTLLGG